MNRLFICSVIGLLACCAMLMGVAPGEESAAHKRQEADSAAAKGNFKQAYDLYAALAAAPDDDVSLVPHDLLEAMRCLASLGRSDEVDAFREKVIAAHGHNWRLLQAAAQSYITGENYGYIVAGQFYRGNHRGNDGRRVYTLERDRVRALQLMQQAMEDAEKDPSREERGGFYFALADMLLDNRGGGGGAWRLADLSDLSKLPDYSDGYPAYYYGGETPGAPVNDDGSPVYHKLPKSWKEAASDGERWRWSLARGAEMGDVFAGGAAYRLADFLRGQFDVPTMAQYGYFRTGPASDADDKRNESGPFAIATLGEDETIARLASGIKRFKLPAEFNFILILQNLADTNKIQGNVEPALTLLANIFEDRRQYDRAAEYWARSIRLYGPGPQNWKQTRLDQIIRNWVSFEGMETEPAGRDATAYIRFRNGNHVSFEAFEVDVPALLRDVKAYIKSKPNQLEWEKLSVDNIGYRLVERDEKQYIKGRVAQWEMDLQPREKHVDKRVKVTVPVKKAGAYLISARMRDGNTSRVVLWSADTVMVKKTLDDGSYYFLADAVTGAPLPRVNLEFFGYRQQWTGDGRTFHLDFKDFAESTDADGQLKLNTGEKNAEFNWLISATTADGRLAYHGFTRIWSGRGYDAQYNQKKAFCMTDRPVYRPGQSVKYKFWIGQAQYDKEGDSPFANQPFNVEIHDPKGEKVLERTFTADAFGGFDGEFPLPSGAMLGQYMIQIPGYGLGQFRVEEYKKPEFEVTVEAPSEPVMLGEKITATIKSRYYFGAPVTSAKVKYKVTRASHSADWYPAARWDWFYEPGYWWFAPDYEWWPGWNEWGCRRPTPMWFGRSWERPEVVSENMVNVGPDGTVKVEIDTALAKAIHGDTDHQYTISAEVTDQSRRTIVGTGNVLVAREPFKVYAWVDRGYYMTGDAIVAQFEAQTLDRKPIKGKGVLKLLRVTYKDRKPIESEIQHWELATDDQGHARQQLKADAPGQYRLSYSVTDAKSHTIEGGYVLVVRGEKFDGRTFRFNDLELITDKREYQAGDTVKLMLNADRADSTVLLFLRPTNGIYLPPRIIHLKGKSAVEEIAVVKKDMPNFFVEALTVSDGKVRDETREVVVPPESRVVNVEVLPSAHEYKPGQKASVRFKLTGTDGKPVEGSSVVTVYDKSVEYISDGSNVPEIKSFFWKWRRAHSPLTESNVLRNDFPVAHSGEVVMGYLGVFGSVNVDENEVLDGELRADKMPRASSATAEARYGMQTRGLKSAKGEILPGFQPIGGEHGAAVDGLHQSAEQKDAAALAPAGSPNVEPAVRTNFADTALWVARLNTGPDGVGEVDLTMPQSLTTWKTKVWTMAAGTRVGEGSADVITNKDVIVRLQAPRFFTQADEVTLSADVHNYLKEKKTVHVALELYGPAVGPVQWVYREKPKATDTDASYSLGSDVEIEAGAEKRVDWRVTVFNPGVARVRVKALTDQDSDAMEMTFPVYVHGMLKTESFSGGMRPKDNSASLSFVVPRERLPQQSRVEVRYSPSVAGAMVDALPYLVDYPYGCTEQTLNRFLPTVITQRVLQSMKLDLRDIEKKRTNLNAQEIEEDAVRAADWKRNNPPNPGVAQRNPVFDVEAVTAMSKEGVTRLTAMQLSDGGWGWFSGFGEESYPHTTALVVHGLQVAQENGVALVPCVLERGIEWLKAYQAREIQKLKNFPGRTDPWKEHADDLDALAFMVLTDAKSAGDNMGAMNDFLYRDRNFIGVYAKAMYALALHATTNQQRLDMLLRNLSQYVVRDNENQTAYLKMPQDNMWWYWYGSDTEAMAYYLKLLSRTDPKGAVTAGLAKYLINNRKNASYWNSTRDTALCIEALADFIRMSGEDAPDETVIVSLDGKSMKQVTINRDNFFSFDNKLVIRGADVLAGPHKLEFEKRGSGPLYFNAYITNFTLENPIKKAGLEIRVQRRFYKLSEVEKKIKARGSRGQSVDQAVEKYEREPLAEGATLRSGELVEVELGIDSKNDYEYILFEDMKAAGFEPMEVRSGYNGNDLNAYMELHDERVCFFAHTLARGKHSVSYRLRAEIPGKFSALPTRASAMYAPELRANSDENKLQVVD